MSIDQLPDRALRHDEVAPFGDATPVLFGHYWWQRDRGEPAIRPSTGCLDFSVAAGGDLAAYRWDEGDTVLGESRLVFA